MLSKLPLRTFVPGVVGRPGREEVTVCEEQPPAQPPGNWETVCSEVLVEFTSNSGVAVPPGAQLRVDEQGKPIIYSQDGRLFFSYTLCRTEWVYD
jgi:hypothetical protein